jgi:hypothetical protein
LSESEDKEKKIVSKSASVNTLAANLDKLKKKRKRMIKTKIRMTMKVFSKFAFLAIIWMNQYRPELGVGVENDGVPIIKYLNYNEEWDKAPPSEDMCEFKEYTNGVLKEQDALDEILKKLNLS